MTKTPRRQRRTKVTKRALIAAATISLAACSTGTPNAGPTTVTVTKPASTTVTTPASAPTSAPAPATGQDSSCEVNPSSAHGACG